MIVSLMVSDRAKGMVPPNGVVATPDKVPARLVPTTP